MTHEYRARDDIKKTIFGQEKFFVVVCFVVFDLFYLNFLDYANGRVAFFSAFLFSFVVKFVIVCIFLVTHR